MGTYFTVARRSLAALLIASGLWLAVPGTALAGNIYDSQVLKRMKFSPGQRTKVRKVLRQSNRELAAIFRKYRINPNAKPVFKKLRKASGELQAVQSREKRKMKSIMSRNQYKSYLRLLQETSARVIKATRKKP